MRVERVLWVVVCLVAAGSALAGSAEVPPGVGAASFARWGIDARPSAMGGAFVAVAEGSPAAYYNPAGLGRRPTLAAGGMYTTPYGFDFGVSLQYANLTGTFGIQTGSELPESPGWAITWVGLAIEDITLYDDDGIPSVVNAYSSLFLGSAGVALPGAAGVWVGASAKVYTDSLLEGRSFGMGVDLATLAQFPLGDVDVSVALCSRDVGRTKVRWSGTAGEPDNFVPWVNKFGLAAELDGGFLLVAGDFDWAVDRGAEEQVVHVGVEVRPVEWIALRGGWRGDLDGAKSSFSAGVGLTVLGGLLLDYAYVPGSVFGAGHVLSINYEF